MRFDLLIALLMRVGISDDADTFDWAKPAEFSL